MLSFKNLSRADLTNNRKADLVAKEQLESYVRRESLLASRVLCYIQEHHLWLAKLHKHLSEDTSNRVATEVGGHDQAPAQPSIDHKALYPRWAWDAVFASYTTSSPAVGFDFAKYKGKIKEANWSAATSWMVQQKWQLGDSYSTSFLELAAQCFVDGIHFVPCGDEIESLKAIVAHLRATVAASLKLGAALCPGLIDYTASKCNGHRHPNGTIKGAKVFLSNKALHLLATGFEKGATAKLSTWAMLASTLLWLMPDPSQPCLGLRAGWRYFAMVGARYGGAASLWWSLSSRPSSWPTLWWIKVPLLPQVFHVGLQSLSPPCRRAYVMVAAAFAQCIFLPCSIAMLLRVCWYLVLIFGSSHCDLPVYRFYGVSLAPSSAWSGTSVPLAIDCSAHLAVGLWTLLCCLCYER